MPGLCCIVWCRDAQSVMEHDSVFGDSIQDSLTITHLKLTMWSVTRHKIAAMLLCVYVSVLG